MEAVAESPGAGEPNENFRSGNAALAAQCTERIVLVVLASDPSSWKLYSCPGTSRNPGESDFVCQRGK